jgi:hypothetical protein
MRAIGVASAALLGVTTLACSAPAAVASGGYITPFGFTVLPSTVAPGGRVTLWLDRDDGGCKAAATVRSAVFDTVTIPRGHSRATAVVDRDARPGATYRVTFTCNGASGSTDLAISGGRHVGRAPVPVPDRGVKAGVGGTFAGFDLKELGLGAALVAGSLGTAYHFSRRRTEEDGA